MPPASRENRQALLLLAVALAIAVLAYRIRQVKISTPPVRPTSATATSESAEEERASRVAVLCDDHHVTDLHRGSLQGIRQADMRDPASQEVQRGWVIADLLARELDPKVWKQLGPKGRVVFRSTVKHEKATVSWGDLQRSPEKLLLVPARHGTHFKVCGALPGVSKREEWVRWVTSIEVNSGATKHAPVNRNR